jgi:predicted lipoprotein with Yx(FWY)xxD motif
VSFTEESQMRRFVIAAAVVVLSACSTMEGMMGSAPAAPTKTVDGVLANSAGMTLYTFDKDTAGSGKSVCNGPCAANWPPLMAAGDAKASGDYSVITRDDGGKQWAYKGKPLYLWVKDSKPGDKTGDGFNNAWRVARP